MPKTIKQEDGTEVQVPTDEEIANEKAAAVAAKENELNSEIETLKTDLDKLKGKDFDFTALRKNLEHKEKELDELKTTQEKEAQERKEKEEKDKDTALISTLAGNDEELKKKIEFHAARINEPDRDKRYSDALKLAMGESGSVLNQGQVISSGGGGAPKTGEIPSHLIPHAEAMGMTASEFTETYKKARQKGLIKE